ncbi:hypothetical protein R0J88_23370, partial [Pseudoalteromonas sp. SIMBA_162]
ALRYGRSTELITNLIFLFAYAVILLPIILYSGAIGLQGMLDLPSLTGISSPNALLWMTIWVVGIIGAIYALFGGMRSI